MLVQLSPFQTVTTSVKASRDNRRKRRYDQGAHFDVPAQASFIVTSSRRGQLKWKHHSAEFVEKQAFLLVSSDHHIATIGRSKEHSYDEFSSLQYSSRPGAVGSFGPNGKDTDGNKRIAAIFDAKNEQVYALQHGNMRLCCWGALTGKGPDDKDAAKVDLRSPAVSMSLLQLHKGVIFGSCADASIFIARVELGNDGSNSLAVEYMPSNLQLKEFEIAGTLAELPEGSTRGKGQKRKMSDADGHTKVYFYQVLTANGKLTLARHEVQFDRFGSSGKILVDASFDQRLLEIPLSSKETDRLVNVELLPCNSGGPLKACITYQVLYENNGAPTRNFCAIVSLSSGELIQYTFALPEGATQCGMISEKLMVAAGSGHLYLVDAESGSILHALQLPKEINDADCWRLFADFKFRSLAIIYPKGELLSCAVSSVLLDDDYEALGRTNAPLASKLASSIVETHSGKNPPSCTMVGNVLKFGKTNDPSPIVLEDAVAQALGSLEAARSKILEPAEEDVDNYLFINTYESSVATVLSSMKEVDYSHDGSPHNPQDDSYSNNTAKPEGSKTHTPKKGLNGTYTVLTPRARALTPSILPQAFIDRAAIIVLRLLQCGTVEQKIHKRVADARLDARVILHHLLSTGKMSARFHFDENEASPDNHPLTRALRSIKLSRKRGRRYFSPVDMILTMLQRCPDVSERQMVIMISYMMRRALPEDIALMFFDERRHTLHSQYADLARKYFAMERGVAKSASEREEHSKNVERIEIRLVLTGTSYVLYRMMSYSYCNESMLRAAMQDAIESHEAVILARCLSNIFATTRKQDMILKKPPSVNALKSVCQWVSALTDGFHDDLLAARDAKGSNYLSVLLNAVNLASKQSEEIVSLKEDLRRVEADLKAEMEAKKTPIVHPLPNPEDLPGYSVEMLSF